MDNTNSCDPCLFIVYKNVSTEINDFKFVQKSARKAKKMIF